MLEQHSGKVPEEASIFSPTSSLVRARHKSASLQMLLFSKVFRDEVDIALMHAVDREEDAGDQPGNRGRMQ